MAKYINPFTDWGGVNVSFVRIQQGFADKFLE